MSLSKHRNKIHIYANRFILRCTAAMYLVFYYCIMKYRTISQYRNTRVTTLWMFRSILSVCRPSAITSFYPQICFFFLSSVFLCCMLLYSGMCTRSTAIRNV